MLHETALIWWHLGILGKRRYQFMIEKFGDLDTALTQITEEVLRESGMKQEAVWKALERLASLDIADLDDRTRRNEIQLTSLEDDSYPALLREIGDPPLFVSYRGDLSILSRPSVGLVGTRGMTQYGRRVAARFVEPLVQAGLVTVSGLARGIDTIVAEDTLKAGGKTVAVLGHGLGMIFPKENERLADRIVEHGGLLVSEFPLDFQADVYTFPARNRIIAALSLGTVVLEAPIGSGAIITAELALDYGREVFAVPGQIFDENAAGSHQLIAKGQARLVSDPAEVLRELGFMVSETENPTLFSSYEPQTPDEKLVLGALSGLPATNDELMEKTGLSASALGIALTMMELAGAAKGAGPGKWVKG